MRGAGVYGIELRVHDSGFRDVQDMRDVQAGQLRGDCFGNIKPAKLAILQFSTSILQQLGELFSKMVVCRQQVAAKKLAINMRVQQHSHPSWY